MKSNMNEKLIFRGLIVSSVSLILFALNHNFYLAHVLLFGAGFGTIVAIALLNTQVQLIAPDQMRGRVIAVYLTMFVGMMPVGNAFAGALAERTSVLFAIGFNALIVWNPSGDAADFPANLVEHFLIFF